MTTLEWANVVTDGLQSAALIFIAVWQAAHMRNH